jgi:hypothetical protein
MNLFQQVSDVLTNFDSLYRHTIPFVPLTSMLQRSLAHRAINSFPERGDVSDEQVHIARQALTCDKEGRFYPTLRAMSIRTASRVYPLFAVFIASAGPQSRPDFEVPLYSFAAEWPAVLRRRLTLKTAYGMVSHESALGTTRRTREVRKILETEIFEQIHYPATITSCCTVNAQQGAL